MYLLLNNPLKGGIATSHIFPSPNENLKAKKIEVTIEGLCFLMTVTLERVNRNKIRVLQVYFVYT